MRARTAPIHPRKNAQPTARVRRSRPFLPLRPAWATIEIPTNRFLRLPAEQSTRRPLFHLSGMFSWPRGSPTPTKRMLLCDGCPFLPEQFVGLGRKRAPPLFGQTAHRPMAQTLSPRTAQKKTHPHKVGAPQTERAQREAPRLVGERVAPRASAPRCLFE